MDSEVTIVGIRDVDFVDEKGRPVKGFTVYFLCESERVVGRVATDVFINRSMESLYAKVKGLMEKVRYGSLEAVFYYKFSPADRKPNIRDIIVRPDDEQ